MSACYLKKQIYQPRIIKGLVTWKCFPFLYENTKYERTLKINDTSDRNIEKGIYLPA